MNDALSNIKILEKYIAVHKNDAYINNALSKLIETKIWQIDKDIDELKAEVFKFEKLYQMKSDVFNNKYYAGELEDKRDFKDWAACYKMLQNRIDVKAILKEY